jgi:hypothetical protein
MRTTFERLFVVHPRSVNEDYLAHAGVALRFAVLLLGAGLAALVHAVIRRCLRPVPHPPSRNCTEKSASGPTRRNTIECHLRSCLHASQSEAQRACSA